MNPVRTWNTFWFGPISGRPLGAFRIVLGLLALMNLAMLTVDMDYWLTGQGLLQGTEAAEVAGPWRPSPLQYWQDPLTVRVVFGLTAGALVGLTLGWRTRVMSVLAYLGMLAIHHRNIPTLNGADVLLMTCLFALMFCSSGAAYSLDARRAARRRGGTVAEPLIVPWGQRLIQVQLAVMYFVTALLKASGPAWIDGSALHYVLNNPEVGRFSLQPLPQYPILMNALTHGALLLEFCLAFMLWFRPTRRWVILAGVAFHATILLAVNAPLFGELSTAIYLCFLSPDELDAFLGWLDVRRFFRRSQPTQVEPANGPTEGAEEFYTDADADAVEYAEAVG